MTVNLQAPNPDQVLAVPGVRLGIAEAGVRKVGRKDLTVILLDEGSAVSGVFTQNRFCARRPILWHRCPRWRFPC